MPPLRKKSSTSYFYKHDRRFRYNLTRLKGICAWYLVSSGCCTLVLISSLGISHHIFDLIIKIVLRVMCKHCFQSRYLPVCLVISSDLIWSSVNLCIPSWSSYLEVPLASVDVTSRAFPVGTYSGTCFRALSD